MQTFQAGQDFYMPRVEQGVQHGLLCCSRGTPKQAAHCRGQKIPSFKLITQQLRCCGRMGCSMLGVLTRMRLLFLPLPQVSENAGLSEIATQLAFCAFTCASSHKAQVQANPDGAVSCMRWATLTKLHCVTLWVLCCLL